ncbi:MAG: bifunctional oligoribonuclease/PAP phosphatase NrnA [Planctomycetes bacterium]|nr:bifunctional oligoribonuclease/PAP phosphatase NrnA [Planctomycetota bacterium]
MLAALAAMHRPVVIAHVVPDADALGSVFALAIALDSPTCHPRVSLPDGSLSQRLRFLYDMARVHVASPEDFQTADGFIALDTAKLDRCNVGPALKGTDWFAGRPLVNVDHHSTNTKFGTVNWVVDTASSTCELAYYVLRAAGRTISPTAASLLYAGIQTDTLGFSLPTVMPAALRAAGDLVELGADVGDLGERLCRSQSNSEFDLLRLVYANTRVLAEGRLAYSSASYEEIHGAGCTAADIDDQINVPRSLSGVELAMLFTEGRKGKTRINFRSSGAVTVIDLAAEFGGGGHMQAAGSVIDGSLSEVIEKVVPRAVEHLRKFGPTT